MTLEQALAVFTNKDVWTAFVGIGVGALITWGVSHRYYKKAGDELRAEAAELRKLAGLALVVLTDPKANYKLTFDAAGAITGINLRLGGQSMSATMGKASPTNQRQPPQQSRPS